MSLLAIMPASTADSGGWSGASSTLNPSRWTSPLQNRQAVPAVKGDLRQHQRCDAVCARHEQMRPRLATPMSSRAPVASPIMRPVSLTSPGLYQRLTVKTPLSLSVLMKARQPSSVYRPFSLRLKGPGAGRRPRVDHAHLHQIERSHRSLANQLRASSTCSLRFGKAVRLE